MSELKAIAGRLRALAEDASPLAPNVQGSARRLATLAKQVESLGRSGVDVGPLLAALQQAEASAQSAADAAAHVRREGVAWADHLALGGTSGQPRSSSGHGGEAGGLLRSAQGRSAALDEIRTWLGDINPGFTGDPFDPRSSNCGQCAAAVHARLSGQGAHVAGTGSLTTPEMEAWTGKRQVQRTPDEIASLLRARGPGSHAVVGVDRSDGPGHWFNAYFDGTDVFAIDGQTGTISPWPPDYGSVILWDAGL